MITNLKNIAVAMNMSFVNPKYNTFSKSSFSLEVEFLVNGQWISRLFDSKTSDKIEKEDYYISDSNIKAMRVKRLLYNNQEIPEADWNIENLVLDAKRSYSIAPFRKYDDESGLEEIVKDIMYKKHKEIWAADLPYPPEFDTDSVTEDYFVMMYCIELRIHNKVLILNSPDISADDVSARIEKVKRQGGDFLMKNGNISKEVTEDKIDDFVLEYIEEVKSYPSETKDGIWYIDYEIKDDNSIDDVYIVSLQYDKRFIIKKDKALLNKEEHKMYFDVEAAFKDYSVYIYDGRGHSLINPLTNDFFEDDELKELIKQGLLRIPVDPDMEVYTEEELISYTLTDFMKKLDADLAYSMKFMKINEDWLSSSLFEAVKVKGSHNLESNIITFDEEGNAYVPIVPKDWLVVKKVTLVDEEDNIANTGHLTVYNSNGTPVYSESASKTPSVHFTINKAEGDRYLFKLDNRGIYVNPQQAKKTKVNYLDITSSMELLKKGYLEMLVPSKGQRIPIDSYKEPEPIDTSIEFDSITISGWWGNIEKTDKLLPTSWYARTYDWSIAQIRNVNKIEQNQMSLVKNEVPFDEPSVQETDLTVTPDSFKIQVNIGKIKHKTKAKSFTTVKYIDEELNVTNLIKGVSKNPETDLAITDMKIRTRENNNNLDTALTASMNSNFKKMFLMNDFVSTTRKLFDFYVTYKNKNLTSEKMKEPLKIYLMNNIPVSNPMFFMFDVSSGPLEVDIAKKLMCNPEDVNLADYDSVKITQKTLENFIILRDLDAGNNLKAQIMRKLSFSGTTSIEDEPKKVIPGGVIYKFSKDMLKKAICFKEGLPGLPEYYNDQISLTVKSDNVLIKHYMDADYTEINDVKILPVLTDVDYLVDETSSVIDKPIYKITNVMFRSYGSYRLNENYLKPILTSEPDGTGLIKGYTNEEMVFFNTVNIKDDVSKNELLKPIVLNLSLSNVLYSRLFKRIYSGTDKYSWSIKSLRNEYRDKYFKAKIENDNFLVSTEVEVYHYMSLFFIPISTTEGMKNSLLLGKESLKNYKPRDIYGNVYPHNDIENVEYMLANEIDDIDFSWANTPNKKRLGHDDILYSYRKPKYVDYSIIKKVSGVMPENRTYEIQDLNEEKFRPRNSIGEHYDYKKTLAEVEYSINNPTNEFDVVWSDTKHNLSRKGIESLIIKKRGV